MDENNVLIEGHGRLKALRELGIIECECIRLKHLTEQQKKAYILVHNKLTMNTEFNQELLEKELGEIFDIDMTQFDFSFEFPETEQTAAEEDTGYYGDERERTAEAYNLYEFDDEACEGYYQMPALEPCNYVPKDIISFNHMLSAQKKDVGIHFYIDDYQFERIWSNPQMYIEKLREYECVFTPDFSLYAEMPMAMKIWNIYRSRLIGQMCQRYGINVIPTVSWCEESTFDFCFDGLPKKSTLSISTIGVKRDKEAFGLWKAGVDKMIEKLHPHTLLIYGGEVEYDYGDIKTVYYKNHVTDRWRGGE